MKTNKQDKTNQHAEQNSKQNSKKKEEDMKHPDSTNEGSKGNGNRIGQDHQQTKQNKK